MSAVVTSGTRRGADAVSTTSEVLERECDAIADEMTELFLSRHLSWLLRCGPRARMRAREDAAIHVGFLAGAITAADPHAFAEYVRWTSRLLRSRLISDEYLEENLRQLRATACLRLDQVGRDLVSETVEVGIAALREHRDELGTVPCRPHSHPAQPAFLDALLRASRREAMDVALDLVRSGAPLMDVYVDVVQASLVEIGRLWETAQVCVSTEHAATAIAQVVLARLSSEERPRARERRGSVVVAGIDGELHQVGCHIVADALEADGWDVRLIGTNAPESAIMRAVDDAGASIVGLSITMLATLPRVARLVATLRERPNPPKILVGGGVLRIAPSLARAIGADLFALDARETCAKLRT